MRSKYPVTGRPPGQGPTRYWTEEDRELVRAALLDLKAKMPKRSPGAIVRMMLRIESGDV